MAHLPIDKIRDSFLESDSFIKVVRADTGSGKTTRIPLWLLEDGIPFILIEPRRVVVKSIFEYIRQISPKTSLGYQVRFEKKIPSSCQGMIVTPGIFLNYLSSSLPLEPEVILIDEFHERNKEVDFLLAILRKRMNLKFVLLSATLDPSRLQSYLDFESFDVSQGSFPIETFYENQEVIPNFRDLPQRVMDGLERFSWKVALVFLPGKREIFELKAYLNARGFQEVYPVHGNQSLAEQHRALRTPGSRILLATNLLESAVTVEGVDLIIDSGLCRALRYHYGQEVLTMEPIAEDAADQRKGRTGRTSPGICYRLWHKSARLEERTRPEILRSELSDLYLRGKQIGVNSRELDYLDCPEPYQWEQAESRLNYLGIGKRVEKEGRELPVSAQFLAMIRRCQELYPRGLEYLLFFISFIESSSSRSPFQYLRADEKGIPPDWMLWLMKDRELSRVMGVEFESFRRTFELLCEHFRVKDFDDPFGLEERTRLIQMLSKDFPRSLYYHSKKTLWRNDFSSECQISELVNPKYVDAVFVLNLFEIEDLKKRRTVLAEVFLCLEKRGTYQFPSTRTREREVRIKGNQVYSVIDHYFGPNFLFEEVLPLHGEEFISGFCTSSNLESHLPGLEEFLFYLEISNSRDSGDIDTGIYLKARLKSAGVSAFEDLELLSLEDLFDQEFLWELPRLQKEYPRQLEEPGGKYSMEYDLKKKEVIFHQEKGSKEPSNLLKKRFSNWKLFWSSRGRCVGI